MNTNLQGKIALVTGGASGIGKLLSLELGQRGCTVVVWDINQPNLDSFAAEAKACGVTAHTAVCDLADKAQIYAKAQILLSGFGRLDILVNNAGVVSGKTLLDTSDEKIEQTFAVNALAHFWMVKAFLPGMLARNAGHIVSVASAAGLVGVSGLTDYSASKFAVFGFHEALRMELRKQKSAIKTTIVCPFYISTGLFEGVKTRFSWLLPIMKPSYVVKRMVKAIARGRQRLILPGFVYSIFPLRLLPIGVFDFLTDFFGISASMDEFTGRNHD